ncbi:transporter substrate-binding domain-containing protein [Xinfangfangia sp. CPCC 101601]|uniref:Transporter substrate-binding domain-containing protein n=1 Tax=Pseudogemmobacter lacusdianii TaxID=3069608 RepID=A0ABU0VXW0_9RHOB|nr:transporter substrate-binding domain-containing protein [Xinfangfangia sp. CPCC 101601]MDQ2065745.1 transporter substrate-binding domain-containing protein [Xinfangfangia sp. CPCC 101601]
MKKLVLATALMAFGAAAQAQDAIKIATEGAYEPYNYIDQATGALVGFEVDLAAEICARAALSCEVIQNEWDSIIPNLQSGNYDAIMAGMSITEERQKVITFSENYTPPSKSAYMAASPEANIGDGAVIAAQVSTIQAGYIAEQAGVTLLEFASPDETVAAVKNGEADAVFADLDYLVPIAGDSGGELVMLNNDVALGGGIGIGLRQSDTELKAKLDGAIQSMKADGSLNALIEKYFGPEAEKF